MSRLSPPMSVLDHISEGVMLKITFWPTPDTAPRRYHCMRWGNLVDLYDLKTGERCGFTRFDPVHRSPSLYSAAALPVLQAWLAVHGAAYINQEALASDERYRARHPNWEINVIYPREIGGALLRKISQLEKQDVPWDQWPSSVGAAKRVLDYDGMRQAGVDLYDPTTHAPILTREDIADCLTRYHCLATSVHACNAHSHLFAGTSPFPRASVWVFLGADDLVTGDG